MSNRTEEIDGLRRYATSLLKTRKNGDTRNLARFLLNALDDVARLAWWAEHGVRLYQIERNGASVWIATWEDANDEDRDAEGATYQEAIDNAMTSVDASPTPEAR